MNDIDVVIPYVNNNDRVWQKNYINYCVDRNYINRITDMRGNRYDDNNMFEYLIRGIEKFMPFVNKIYLLVSNKEQVPLFIKKHDKVKVVLHREFIYSQYLPTFNSTTIEIFLWNIKGLGERFIYINDDMFPIGKLDISDFFTKEGKVKMNMAQTELGDKPAQFRQVCYNSYKSVLNGLKMSVKGNSYIKPDHTFTPMIKSHVKTCYKMLEKDISKNIRAFRTEKQVNQYIYPIYELVTENLVASDIKFKYCELNEELVEFIGDEIKNKEYQVICINDNCIKRKININYIKKAFEEILCV